MSLCSGVPFRVRRSVNYDSASSSPLREAAQLLAVTRRGNKRQFHKAPTSSSPSSPTVLQRSSSMSGRKLNKVRSIVRHWKKLTHASQSRYLALSGAGSDGGRDGEKIGDSTSTSSCFSSSCSSLDFEDCIPKSVKNLARSASASDVPDGCLALFVGREKRRFVIGAHYLEHNLFRGLLERSAAEFGIEQKGGINIACEVVLFEHLLWLIGTDDPSSRHLQVDELLDFYAY